MDNGIVIALVIILIYFLPSVLAHQKKKKNENAIVLVNLFLGWTLIGWFVALVWATTNDDKAHTVIVPKEKDEAEQLEKLAELKNKGVITDADFEAKKKKILGI